MLVSIDSMRKYFPFTYKWTSQVSEKFNFGIKVSIIHVFFWHLIRIASLFFIRDDWSHKFVSVIYEFGKINLTGVKFEKVSLLKLPHGCQKWTANGYLMVMSQRTTGFNNKRYRACPYSFVHFSLKLGIQFVLATFEWESTIMLSRITTVTFFYSCSRVTNSDTFYDYYMIVLCSLAGIRLHLHCALLLHPSYRLLLDWNKHIFFSSSSCVGLLRDWSGERERKRGMAWRVVYYVLDSYLSIAGTYSEIGGYGDIYDHYSIPICCLSAYQFKWIYVLDTVSKFVFPYSSAYLSVYLKSVRTVNAL